MRSAEHRFFAKSIVAVIMALFLMGTVPSFATDEESEERDLTVLPSVEVTDEEAPKLNGTSTVLMDLESGSILYEKEADKVREPASLTKILTCLVILEEMDLNETVTIREGIETEGSIIGLVPGEKITIKDLLYGMMIESGNDAAEALAVACDGNINDFADRMNERAVDCGALNSEFRNPNGLNEDRSRLNWSTARDLCLITAEAMENETFREIVSTPTYTIPATNKSDERKLRNSNRCLWDKDTKVKVNGKERAIKYDGCTGIKTGMTSDAGECFIGSVKRGDRAYLTVTMNADDTTKRFTDAIKLWDFAFERFDTYTLLTAGEKAGVQRVEHGSVRKVDVAIRGDFAVTINKDDKADPGITTEFLLDKERLTAPVEEGVPVGSVIALDQRGRLVGERTLYTTAAVPEGGPLSYIGIEDKEAPWVTGIAGAIVLIIIIIAITRGRSRRKEKRQKMDDMKSKLVNMRTAGEGMTPKEWNELTGDPKEAPIQQGPARLTDAEFEEINKPEITRSARPQEKMDQYERPDPDKPVRHGRMSKEEIDDLLAGRMTEVRRPEDKER